MKICILLLMAGILSARADTQSKLPGIPPSFDEWLADFEMSMAELHQDLSGMNADLDAWLAEGDCDVAELLQEATEAEPEISHWAENNSFSLSDFDPDTWEWANNPNFPFAEAAPAEATTAPAKATVIFAETKKVYYSFNRYAANPKMDRTYVSKEMLQAAGSAGAFKSSAFDISPVASRLTSLLSMHTHSRSTTNCVRQDLAKVSQMIQYDHIMQKKSNDTELYIFCHRRNGKKIDELLVFRFRDTYCSRVIQLTGDLRTDDIAAILKMSK